MEIIDTEDSKLMLKKRLPVLELESKEQLVSPNAASFLLFPPAQDIENNVIVWTEWDFSELLPSVFASSRGKNDEISGPLAQCLHHLDSSLNKKQYLVKDALTVADVVVWSTLYPIFTETTLTQDLEKTYQHVSKWFAALQSLPQFKTSVRKLNSKEAGLVLLQSISAANPFFSANNSLPPTSNTTKKQKSEGKVKNLSKQKEQPKKAEESKEKMTGLQTDSPAREPVNEGELKSAEESWLKGKSSRPVPKPKTVTVLPVTGEKNILVTSALPYVNNVPHLGNIIGCVLSADVFARYCRLRNWNTLYISGTDEYGTATETKALEEGLTPREICDKYFAIHEAIYKWFNIEFDLFGRTTTPEQTEIVQELFLNCHKNGYTSTAYMEQLLCEKCDRYLADRFVEGTCPKCKYEDARGDQCDGCGNLINAVELISPRCKLCSSPPVVRESQQMFLDLPKIEKKLEEWSAKVSSGWSHNADVITKAWLKDGLKPRCITRDLKWGIPVPLEGFEQKVFYVWFDAPIGYMSMTKCYTDRWRSWWHPANDTEVTLYQFMAKDNVPFHSIMFPTTIMSQESGYVLVNHLMATEYLNYEDGKFSKSRGVGVFGNDAQDTGIPSDIFRFYLLFVRPENQDSSFSWADLAMRNNTELLNNLGNFVNRSLMFAEKYFDSTIPEMTLNLEDYTLLVRITQELKGYIECLNRARLRDGIKQIMNISRYGNGYMQASTPWVLIKGSEEEKTRAGTIIGLSCNIACLLAILLKPYMPESSRIMAEQMQAPDNVFVITENVTQLLPPGHKIGKPAPLFTKIEQATVDQLKQRFAGRQKSASPPAAETPENKKAEPVNNHVNSDIFAIQKMEEAVANQAELVRSMKTSGAPKEEWQPHVTVLLEMKKKLAAMKGEPEVTNKKDKSSKKKEKSQKGKSS